jgi:transcriptional accessory protein Tex/SPT6
MSFVLIQAKAMAIVSHASEDAREENDDKEVSSKASIMFERRIQNQSLTI